MFHVLKACITLFPKGMLSQKKIALKSGHFWSKCCRIMCFALSLFLQLIVCNALGGFHFLFFSSFFPLFLSFVVFAEHQPFRILFISAHRCSQNGQWTLGGGEEAVTEIKVAVFSSIYVFLNLHPTSITLLGKESCNRHSAEKRRKRCFG